jgi:molybdenum cofactor cytidylyltransferase
MIQAVILAAGKSERMGSPKPLLPWGKRTLIEATIDGIARSLANEILVVLGAAREVIEPVIAKYHVGRVFNPDFGRGMLSSIQRGLGAVPRAARAVLFFLGDQPPPHPAMINRLIRAYNNTGKGIVLPVHGGRRGHPVLIDLKYRNAIRALDPGIGLRQLVRDHPEDVLEVRTRSPRVLHDIDTPEDYERALESRRRRRK